MKLNYNDYKYSLEKRNAAELLRDLDGQPSLGKIGKVAVATDIPIIAVAHHYGQTFGYNDKLHAYIDRLCSFYDIKEVIVGEGR